MRLFVSVVVLCLLCSPSPSAWADEGPESPNTVQQARAEFVAGAELAREMLWGQALARFEASSRLHAHPGTTYNIGICLRALGQFVRAKAAFSQAQAQHEAGLGSLAEHMLQDIAGFLEEIARVVAHVDVTLVPDTVNISLNGRGLEVSGKSSGLPVLIEARNGDVKVEAAPGPKFRLLLDPGSHVLVISRRGYGDVVRRLNLEPGSRTTLSLELRRLPGTLRVTADRAGAAVEVGGLDVGVVPVTLSRPAGQHRVVVRKPGFVTYRTTALLSPGGGADLRAELPEQPVALTERWWFWTGIGVLATGVGVGTYLLTRPDPERPAVGGGSLGWAARVP